MEHLEVLDRTRTCVFRRDRVFRGEFLAGSEVTLEDAKANIAATARLTGGRRTLILVDLRGVRSQSPEARAYFTGAEASAVTAAVALVVGSPLSRAIGNFFLGFNRPPMPARLFTDESAAEAWLLALEPDR